MRPKVTQEDVCTHLIATLILFVLGSGILLAPVLLIILPGSTQDNWVPEVVPAGFEHTEYAETPLGRMCAPSTTTQSFENPRVISNNVFQQATNDSLPDHRSLSALCYLWGQILDHDCVLSRENVTAERTVILVDNDDPFFPDPIANITMKQTLNDATSGTPLNFQTPHIDGSIIYGYDLDYLNTKLRAAHDGLMLVDDESYLPMNEAGQKFISGDERVNEHIGLTAMHTLWVREHNRLAKELKRDWHPTWSDEQLFWKARQLVVAKMQHITMQEWLPAMVGRPTAPAEFDILLANDGLQLDVEWTAAIFRIGHSMVPFHFVLDDDESFIRLPRMFMNATLFRQLGVSAILRSHAQTPNQRVDDKVVHALRNILFRMSGHDLVAFNIQRGRMLQLPSYVEYMRCVTRPTLVTEANDVDLFVGVLQEPLPSDGQSSLPPTIAYIFEHQLNKIRTGDPNWYEWPSQRAAIGPHYYPLIEQTTLAKVMALNNVSIDADAEVFYTTT